MIADEVNFCPRCGTGLNQVRHFGHIRPTCPKCDWVFFPDPKVAVAVLILEEGRILLVRRTNQPQQWMWTLPAGFVDAGEDPKLAAERECFEETGLRVKVTDLINVYSGREHERGADILITYKADVQSGVLIPGDDADRATFFQLDDLPPLAFNSTNEMLNSLLRENTQESSDNPN
jgi:ADP-ribose pyrophosphatase YjhB (NUDIX family)